MKTTRRFIIFGLAWFVMLGASAVLPAHVYGLRFGEGEMWRIDVARIALYVVILSSATGLVFWREWARKAFAALAVISLGRGLLLLLLMRNAPWDLFGFFLFAVMLGVLGVVCVLLLRARDLTAEPPSISWKRTLATILTIAAGVGLWGISFIEEDDDTEAFAAILPVQRDLDFLVDGTWGLEKLRLVGHDDDGDAIYSPRESGRVLVRTDGEHVVLEGVPGFRNLLVRIDVARNIAYLDGSAFVGTPFRTDRFLWKAQVVRGVTFENEFGRITGEIVIGQRDDGDLFIVAGPFSVMGKEMEFVYVGTPEA